MQKNLWLRLKSNILNALIGIVPGVYILLMATGVIRVAADAVTVPMWLLFIIGTIFVIAGVSALGEGVFSFSLRNLLGVIIVTIFYIIALWISTGPGERVFVGIDPVIGRIAFGVAALLLFFMTVIAWRTILVSWRVFSICLLLVGSTLICLGYWWLNQEEPHYLGSYPELPREKLNNEHLFVIEKVWDFPFNLPRALAVDPIGNIYVSETYKTPGDTARILKFDPNGVLLGWWGKGDKTSGWHASTSSEVPAGIGRGPGEFVYIMKITFDTNGNMYVVDRGTYYDADDRPQVYSFDAVQRFDQVGNFTGMIYDETSGWMNEYVSGDGVVLSEPTCIIVAGDDLLVGSYDDNRLNKFSLNTGELQAWFGKSVFGTYGWHPTNVVATSAPYFGTETGAFSGLIDCEKKNDLLYIVSYNSNPVVGIFDYQSGAYRAGLSHNDGHKPQEIIVDIVGNVVFSDNYQGSVKFLDQKLTPLDTLQLGPGGNYFAVGDFAFSTQGNLLFIEQQKQRLYELRVDYLK